MEVTVNEVACGTSASRKKWGMQKENALGGLVGGK